MSQPILLAVIVVQSVLLMSATWQGNRSRKDVDRALGVAQQWEDDANRWKAASDGFQHAAEEWQRASDRFEAVAHTSMDTSKRFQALCDYRYIAAGRRP